MGTTQKHSGLSEKHALWLESRALSIERAAEVGLYSVGENLAFPYPDATGKVQFTKFRGPGKKFWIEPGGQTLQPWLLHRWSDDSAETLIVTEGEIDALSILTAAGHYPVMSVPNGAPAKIGDAKIINPLEDNAFSYLWAGNDLHPEIARFERIILATDGDGPGAVLRDELAIRLGRDRCHYVTYPKGCKDANDVLMQLGSQAVIDLIEQARPIVPNQLVKFSDIPHARGVSLSSGWSDLDHHLMFCLPEVCVIAGPPNHGKSQFGLALIANLARVHHMRGAILQFEDDVDRHRDDLMRYAKAWREGNGAIVVEKPADWIDRYFLTIAPPEMIDESQTLEWLKERVHEAATRHGCKWILIDPWNEIEHAWGITESETAYTGRALREIRALARRYQLLIIIITHPSKSGGLRAADEGMTMYDIAGSAHWNNKPDHGVLIHRPRGESHTIVDVAKSRDFRRRGRPGKVRMQFDPTTATYSFAGFERN